MPKKSNNKTKTPFSGSPSELLMELMSLLRELNEKLQYYEDLDSEMEQLSKYLPMTLDREGESLESSEILGIPKDYVCVSAITPELIEEVYENLRLSPLESIDLIRELVEALHYESGDIVKGGIQEEDDEVQSRL